MLLVYNIEICKNFEKYGVSGIKPKRWNTINLRVIVLLMISFPTRIIVDLFFLKNLEKNETTPHSTSDSSKMIKITRIHLYSGLVPNWFKMQMDFS